MTTKDTDSMAQQRQALGAVAWPRTFTGCEEEGMSDRPGGSGGTPAAHWTLITSHGLVLLYVAADPNATLRKIAADIELSERRVADIIRNLATAHFVEVKRRGRRNHYSLNPEACFQHPFMADIPFAEFVAFWRRAKCESTPRQFDHEPGPYLTTKFSL
jgi:hypothetical protein